MLRIRAATAADAEVLWRWANDTVVRGNSLSPKAIPWLVHLDWLTRKLASPDTRIYLLEDGTKPVGQIRYDREGEVAMIDVSIAVTERGNAYATRLLSKTMGRTWQELGVARLVARVRPSNTASARLFISGGFQETGRVWQEGVICRQFECWRPGGGA